MTAAMAKVLRAARSGPSSRLTIPAAPAAGLGRLMHTGPKLPLGRQAFSSQRHKNARMERIWENIKSFVSDEGHVLPVRVYCMLCAMSVGIVLPSSSIWRHIKGE